MNFEM